MKLPMHFRPRPIKRLYNPEVKNLTYNLFEEYMYLHAQEVHTVLT